MALKKSVSLRPKAVMLTPTGDSLESTSGCSLKIVYFSQVIYPI